MDITTAEAELARERHRNLNVWKNAVAFTARIYKLTRTFPHEEVFGLTNQLRRASVSGSAAIDLIAFTVFPLSRLHWASPSNNSSLGLTALKQAYSMETSAGLSHNHGQAVPAAYHTEQTDFHH